MCLKSLFICLVFFNILVFLNVDGKEIKMQKKMFNTKFLKQVHFLVFSLTFDILFLNFERKRIIMRKKMFKTKYLKQDLRNV